MLKELPHRKPESFSPCAGDYLDGKDRVAPQREKVVVGAQIRNAEQFRPDAARA